MRRRPKHISNARGRPPAAGEVVGVARRDELAPSAATRRTDQFPGRVHFKVDGVTDCGEIEVRSTLDEDRPRIPGRHACCEQVGLVGRITARLSNRQEGVSNDARVGELYIVILKDENSARVVRSLPSGEFGEFGVTCALNARLSRLVRCARHMLELR
jgi:hypothetical protein